MNSKNDADPYGLRDRKGKWARKGVSKFYPILALVIVGIFIFCPKENYAKDQGILAAPLVEVPEWFKNGNCKHVEILEGVRNYTISCSFADKEIQKRWNEDMQERLQKEVETWKRKAGEPTAILKRVCRNNGFIDSECPKILYAMALQESGMGKWMEGDGGRSHGYFHILNIHNLSKACTHDLACSADFSLKRMIRFGFKTNRDMGIRRHNGGPDDPDTLVYLQKVKSRMAFWPENT